MRARSASTKEGPFRADVDRRDAPPPRGTGEPASTAEAARYWEDLAARWLAAKPQRLWREYCDRLNDSILRPWLGEKPRRRVLKTDLFDEAVGDRGLYSPLAESAAAVFGLDLSPTIARSAGARHPGLRAASADVRRLPFADASFDVVVSNSTLDHFDSLEDVAIALAAIHRVLAPGGELLLTLDNLSNPIVALRALVPRRLLFALHLVPYRVGRTCGPARLRRLLVEAGFHVESLDAAMHCPRLPAVWLAGWLERRDRPRTRARFLALSLGWERLGRLPTRWLTGYFLVARAVRT